MSNPIGEQLGTSGSGKSSLCGILKAKLINAVIFTPLVTQITVSASSYLSTISFKAPLILVWQSTHDSVFVFFHKISLHVKCKNLMFYKILILIFSL